MNTKQIMVPVKRLAIILILISFSPRLLAQNILMKSKHLAVDLLPEEKWWGGLSVEGTQMPFSSRQSCEINLVDDTKGNQGQPFFVSNKGRYLWCGSPFMLKIKDNALVAESSSEDIELGQSGNSLKEGYVYAANRFFPANGMIADSLLFTRPQYNTWIELMYNQNQDDVLKYAHGIVKNNFPVGVLMIDDNWQMDYGNWKFNPEKFRNPKEMCRQLHEMGFKIMLWVCPFVSPDCENFRKLRDKKFLLTRVDRPGEPAIVPWWNGYSALLDLSNPEALKWFNQQLAFLQKEYGVDGFKLDAGDARFYKNVKSFLPVTANDHSEYYAKAGLNFGFNEYRACWKMAGQPLVQRLRDKNCNWDDVRKLIPDMMALSMMGYAYSCPDMIGGGDYISFLDTTADIDQELVVRSAQVHALMPMMQFSVAPWRILNEQNLAAIKKAAALHVQFKDIILSLAKKSAKTGEPVVRPLEYNFPGKGYSEIKDQFMLGDDILVAPVVVKGQRSRQVILPEGKWLDDTGKVFKGGNTIAVDVPVDRLTWFKKLTK